MVVRHERTSPVPHLVLNIVMTSRQLLSCQHWLLVVCLLMFLVTGFHPLSARDVFVSAAFKSKVGGACAHVHRFCCSWANDDDKKEKKRKLKNKPNLYSFSNNTQSYSTVLYHPKQAKALSTSSRTYTFSSKASNSRGRARTFTEYNRRTHARWRKPYYLENHRQIPVDRCRIHIQVRHYLFILSRLTSDSFRSWMPKTVLLS